MQDSSYNILFYLANLALATQTVYKMLMKTFAFKFPAFVLLFLWTFPLMGDSAFAHRVSVFAWVEEDTIHVESKFSGGKKVNGGKVVVMDPQGVELLSGLTNDHGEFSFKIPQQTDLRVIIMAGQGHRGEWTVRKNELQGATSETGPQRAVSDETASSQAPVAENASAVSQTLSSGTPIKPEELEVIVESVLDRKLQPLTRMLADMQQEGPGVSDIFAGIGYILGLVGIAAYVQNRKKKA
jgi:nickel transport protein